MNLDNQKITITTAQWFFLGATILLAIGGYTLFDSFADYRYGSPEHTQDILRAKLWSMVWLGLSVLLVYLFRKREFTPALSVFLLSAYFVVLYGLLFRGTEYGMNGHWGDNGNRLAEICKMMAYGDFFQDWYLKDLPSFYPPLWFALMAFYAKMLSLEAYQTIKFGYLLVFIIYPWLLYFSWKKIVSPNVAAAVTVACIFFGYRYLDWIYYEHITAALFLPWWLYYLEDVTERAISLRASWKFYLVGMIIGAVLFMTYYYWFFIAALAAPLSFAVCYRRERAFVGLWRKLRHQSLMLAGAAVFSCVYWGPLLSKIYHFGSESAQNLWFGLRHADIAHQWENVTFEGVLLAGGALACGYCWKSKRTGPVGIFMIAGVAMLATDRLFNLIDSSVQSRKVLEMAHVFLLAPLAVGSLKLWSASYGSTSWRPAMVAFGMFGLLVFSNEHTQLNESNFYKTAINQRVPLSDLAVFESANTYNTVFLTTHYLESCYLPYYLFIPLNNMTAHIAGRYSQREGFLELASQITEPEFLAYALAHNRYSPVDYLYLPVDSASGNWEITLYQAKFNQRALPKKIIFGIGPHEVTESFSVLNERGLYRIKAAERSAEFDAQLEAVYPEIIWNLEPPDWSRWSD